ncbi:hypothetical protein ACA910_012991 [Epithemia clementina (nom. ined.)]
MKTPLLSLCYLLLVAANACAFVTHVKQVGREGSRSAQEEFGFGYRHKVCISAVKKETKKTTTPPETFKKADFVAVMAERTGVTKKEAEASLQAVVDIIQEQVGQGKKISFPGFGSFTLKDRAERKGRNPQTGEDLVIPASKKPTFTASKTWKDAINGK